MSTFGDYWDDSKTAFGLFREPVTYTRGNDSATVDAERFETSTFTGIYEDLRVEEKEVRFKIWGADLVVGGTAITPAMGDEIAVGGEVFFYASHEKTTEGLEWDIATKRVL